MSRRGRRGFLGRPADRLSGWFARLVKRREGGGLGPGAVLILAVNALFILGVNLSNAYVNVYLWKLNDSLTSIAWYHVYQYISLMVGFVLAGKLAETLDRTVCLRTGVLLHALFFSAVLLLQEDAALHIPRLGTLLGLGSGFYWLGAHVLSFDVTNDENVDYFHGLFSLFGSLGATVAPFVAGWVIAVSDDLTGYRSIFTGSLGLFILTILVSLLLYTRSSDGEFTLKPAFLPERNPEWSSMMLVHLLNGFRNGVFVFLIGILVFFATGTEFGIGLYSLMTGAITLVASYVVGRHVGRSLRKPAIFWGQVATSVSAVILAFWPNLLGLAIFGFIEAVFAPVYGIPFGAMNFQLIHRDPRVTDRRVEYMVAREMPLNVGRLLGLALFIAVSPSLSVSRGLLTAVLLIYGIVPLAGWFLIRDIQTETR